MPRAPHHEDSEQADIILLGDLILKERPLGRVSKDDATI
jgi:hypothetical protein